MLERPLKTFGLEAMSTAASVLALLLAASAPRDCALQNATYRDSEEAGFSLRFESSHPMLAVFESSKTGMSYRFDLNSGNGYATTSMTAHGDASSAGQTIYAIDGDLDVRGEFPTLTESAPLYMFAPEVGRLLWYQAEYMGGPTLASGVRESLPRTFFKLAECRQ